MKTISKDDTKPMNLKADLYTRLSLLGFLERQDLEAVRKSMVDDSYRAGVQPPLWHDAIKNMVDTFRATKLAKNEVNDVVEEGGQAVARCRRHLVLLGQNPKLVAMKIFEGKEERDSKTFWELQARYRLAKARLQKLAQSCHTALRLLNSRFQTPGTIDMLVLSFVLPVHVARWKVIGMYSLDEEMSLILIPLNKTIPMPMGLNTTSRIQPKLPARFQHIPFTQEFSACLEKDLMRNAPVIAYEEEDPSSKTAYIIPRRRNGRARES
ncbi:MAG: hypothetical protein SGILL_002101 [Bacillariaceae sp.]